MRTSMIFALSIGLTLGIVLAWPFPDAGLITGIGVGLASSALISAILFKED